MTVEEHYLYFSALSSMLPKIVHQDSSEQHVSKKYKHNPSSGKKRKLKESSVDDESIETESSVGSKHKKSKKLKAMSVENVPSLEISELKKRLHQKLQLAKVARNHSDAKLQRRKENRKLKAKERKAKNNEIDKEKPVRLETSILDEKKCNTKELKEKAKIDGLQFSKFETKTKEEIDLQSTKKKKKKKNLTKMLDDAKKKKKEFSDLQKSTNEKSATVLQDKAWKKAISMAKGEKQKDNPELIVKTIKRKEQSKKKSAKEWTARVGGQKKQQKEKQKKRQANIDKRNQNTITKQRK